MRRIASVVFCLALILPALAAPPQTDGRLDVAAASSSSTSVCATERQLAANTEYAWRLRAYEDLDCAIGILDDALKTAGDAITLSREKAEHARARMWAARDAAARIGR